MMGLCLVTFATIVNGHETDISAADNLEIAKNAYFESELSRSRELLTPLSENGNVEASHYLALIEREQSHTGSGSLPNAISLWRFAADQGFSPAMWELGSAYDNGDGVPVNIILATHWYRRAERMERNANDVLYLEPLSGSALDALTRRVQAGDADAAYSVGRLFDLGERVEQNLETAVSWYEKAATLGHRESALLLAYFSCVGRGMIRDVQKANQWLLRVNESAVCNDQILPE